MHFFSCIAMCWNIPARSPTQLDICPCANAPKNIKTVTTLAAHPDWPHGPPSETAWTGLHLTQEPQRCTWSKQHWNTDWHVFSVKLKQCQSIQVCVPLGLPKVVECPWKFVLGDWPCHLHHTSFAPGAVHTWISWLPCMRKHCFCRSCWVESNHMWRLSLTGQMNQMGSLRVGHSCWQLSTPNHPSLSNLPCMTWQSWQSDRHRPPLPVLTVLATHTK